MYARTRLLPIHPGQAYRIVRSNQRGHQQVRVEIRSQPERVHELQPAERSGKVRPAVQSFTCQRQVSDKKIITHELVYNYE